MTGVADALAALAAGERPVGEALLHTCMLEGWGTQAYGEEAVVETFRLAPVSPNGWDPVESEAGVALFGDEIALFGDTVEGRFRRIWRLGAPPCLSEERSIFVPFDPDLAQAIGDVMPSDAPFTEDVPIRAVGLSILEAIRSFRGRAFVIRAFRNGPDLALLFAIYQFGGGPVRPCGFSYAAARLRVANSALAGCRIVRDLAGEAAISARPLLPRI